MSARFLASFVACLVACGGEAASLPAEEAPAEPRFITVDPDVARRIVVPGSGPAARPQPQAADPPAPEIGKTYRIAIGDRAVVVNRKPLSDGYRRFRRGSDCRIEPGGSMTILGTRTAGDPPDLWTEYLVRYARPPKTSDSYVHPRNDAKPYACPDGTKFYHDDPLFISEAP